MDVLICMCVCDDDGQFPEVFLRQWWYWEEMRWSLSEFLSLGQRSHRGQGVVYLFLSLHFRYKFVRDDGMCILFHLLCCFLFVCLCLFSSMFSLIVSLLREASHVTWVVMWPGSSDRQEERINSSLSVVTSSFCCAPVSPTCSHSHKLNLLDKHSPVC